MFGYFRGLVTALLRVRYLIEVQPHSLLSGLEKREEIKKWQAMTGHTLFVETGTFLGDTTIAMAAVFQRCWTVEIDEALHQQALRKFEGHQNISAIRGDSETTIAEILKDINAPAIFWLDGHYSRGNTGRGVLDSPIMNELRRIFEHPIKTHVILIDDARLFLGRNGYPTIKALHRFVRDSSPYRMRVTNDIIKLYKEAI